MVDTVASTLMATNLDCPIKPLVLVTGFGPLGSYLVNASWEAVKQMNKEELEKKHNIELVLLEIPVTYENVDESVPLLWKNYKPKLVIHVGVSGAKCMVLEKQAHRQGYQGLDYFNKCPANNVCMAQGPTTLHTKLNVERICKEFNNSNPYKSTSAMSSENAGRYLCEYIYYTSLSVDNNRTLFIHVPDLSDYPSEVTAKALEKIFELCWEQVIELDSLEEISEKK